MYKYWNMHIYIDIYINIQSPSAVPPPCPSLLARLVDYFYHHSLAYLNKCFSCLGISSGLCSGGEFQRPSSFGEFQCPFSCWEFELSSFSSGIPLLSFIWGIPVPLASRIRVPSFMGGIPVPPFILVIPMPLPASGIPVPP